MGVDRKRVTYICNSCSENTVTRDAWAGREQEWVLGAAFDYAFCHDCQAETRLVEIELASADAP
jgi:hypothetical protein